MHLDIDYLGDVKVLNKGQIVIPKEIREKLGIKPGDSLKIMLRGDGGIGIMKEEDLKNSLKEFSKMNFSKKEGTEMMVQMQKQITEMTKFLENK